ncbi:hypothetical protein LXL04_007736 [Taraxacum kok-saghyz]
MVQVLPNIMNSEIQVGDEPLQTDLIENVDVVVNLARDGDESIIGKVFDTLHDAYTFYNQYAFYTRLVYAFIGSIKIRPQMRLTARCNETPFSCKSLMVELGQSGLKPSQIKKAVNAMKAPYESDVTSKQCVDILSEERKQYKGKEFYGLIKHFQDKALVDANQFLLWIYLRTGLLEMFFGLMHPSAIITDQDKAIGNAIKKVFPNTRHRYCEWHIKKHELQHLGSLATHYSDFKESYKKWVKSDTTEEFEREWEVMCVQYDKAVDSRRAVEEDEDFKTMNSKAILSSVHPIEAKAEIKYRIGQVNIDKAHWRFVIYRMTNQVDVKCSCAKFQTYGILCKHSLYVMKKRNVQTLPDHYILSRWTLDARFRVGARSLGLDEMNNGTEVSALTLWYVRSNCTKAIEYVKDSPSKIENLNNLVVKFLEDEILEKTRNVPERHESVCKDSCRGTSQVHMMPQISIRDPVLVNNTKGRSRNANRIKSSLEAEEALQKKQ